MAENNEYVIAKTATSHDVYMDQETWEHIQSAHPDMTKEMIAEAISKMEYAGTGYETKAFYSQSAAIDMGRVVGKTSIRELAENETAEMLYRNGREGKSSIVFDNEKADTNLVFLAMGYIPDKQETYLFTASFGPDAPREPWDKGIKTEEQRKESEQYWKTHAIIVTPEEKDQILDTERNKALTKRSKTSSLNTILNNTKVESPAPNSTTKKVRGMEPGD